MSTLAHKIIALFIVIAITATAFSPLVAIPLSVHANVHNPEGAASGNNDGPDSRGDDGTNDPANTGGSVAKSAASGAPGLAASCGTTAGVTKTGAGVATAESFKVSASLGVLVALPPAISGMIGGQSAANVQNNYKQNCLNAIAWYLAKILIDEIVASTVAWINSGFQGGPTFVTDPGGFFGNVADKHTVQFLNDLFPQTAGLTSILCKPFSFDLEFKLRFKFQYGARFRDTVKCRISDIATNINGFVKSSEESMNDFYGGDFNEGGWNRWFEVTQEPSNNKYGALILAEDRLQADIETAVGKEKMILDWGKGFHSITDGFNQIITPGDTISEALVSVTSTDIRQLELADEFNEIVGALIGQLMKTAFSAGSGGIAGLSDSSANPNLKGKAFLPSLSPASGANEYPIGDTGDTGQSSIPEDTTSTTTIEKAAYNLALQTFGAIAEQRSTYQGDLRYSASMANDGIYPINGNGNRNGINCAVTKNRYTYWQINLGKSKNIERVVIMSDTSTDLGDLANFSVFISDTAFPVGYILGPGGVLEPTATSSTLFADGKKGFSLSGKVPDWKYTIPVTSFSGVPSTAASTTGQFVRIQGNLPSADLNLCEVEVYGTDK